MPVYNSSVINRVQPVHRPVLQEWCKEPQAIPGKPARKGISGGFHLLVSPFSGARQLRVGLWKSAREEHWERVP